MMSRMLKNENDEVRNANKRRTINKRASNGLWMSKTISRVGAAFTQVARKQMTLVHLISWMAKVCGAPMEGLAVKRTNWPLPTWGGALCIKSVFCGSEMLTGSADEPRFNTASKYGTNLLTSVIRWVNENFGQGESFCYWKASNWPTRKLSFNQVTKLLVLSFGTLATAVDFSYIQFREPVKFLLSIKRRPITCYCDGIRWFLQFI